MLLSAKQTQDKKDKISTLFMVGIPVLAATGFAAMYVLAEVLSPSANYLTYGLFTLVVIVLGLATPYWMLKFGAHAAHLRDGREKELELKDIPKDQQQLAEEQNREFPG